jgi:hypothetical protein
MSRLHALVAGALLSTSLVSTASAEAVVLGPAPGVYTFQGTCTDCFGVTIDIERPFAASLSAIPGTPAQATLTMGSNTASYADDLFTFTSNNFPGGVSSISIQSISFGPINGSGFADVRIEFSSSAIFTTILPGGPSGIPAVPTVGPVLPPVSPTLPWYFETTVSGEWTLGLNGPFIPVGVVLGPVPADFDRGFDGRWTQPSQVPLPGTLALIGIACAGFGLQRARRAVAANV